MLTCACLTQADEELALKLLGPLGLRLSAETLLRPHLVSLFAGFLPLPHLLPLWEALLAAPDRNAFLVDTCVAMLTAPALRYPLMLAESPARAALLVELPPALHSNDLLLSAARLAQRLPHPPLAVAPLRPRDEALAVAAAELRALTSWGGRAGRALLDAAARLSEAARGDAAAGALGAGETVSLLPFVHSDGSVGFREVAGGGSGFGDWGPHVGRLAHPFTRFPQVVPRLRLLGADPTAPLANLSWFVQALPPVPLLGEASPIAASEAAREGAQAVGLAGESEEMEALFSYSHMPPESVPSEAPRLRAAQDARVRVPVSEAGKVPAGSHRDGVLAGSPPGKGPGLDQEHADSGGGGRWWWRHKGCEPEAEEPLPATAPAVPLPPPASEVVVGREGIANPRSHMLLFGVSEETSDTESGPHDATQARKRSDGGSAAARVHGSARPSALLPPQREAIVDREALAGAPRGIGGDLGLRAGDKDGERAETRAAAACRETASSTEEGSSQVESSDESSQDESGEAESDSAWQRRMEQERYVVPARPRYALPARGAHDVEVRVERERLRAEEVAEARRELVEYHERRAAKMRGDRHARAPHEAVDVARAADADTDAP